MNKLLIKDISIINKKEKIVGLKLENKDIKFILYSYDNENNKPEETDIFREFSFKDEFNITSKKKMNNLNFNIVHEDESYKLKINNKNIYYIKDTKPIVNDNNFKIILNNGKLYESKEIDINVIEECDLVNQILNKSETDTNIQKLDNTKENIKEYITIRETRDNIDVVIDEKHDTVDVVIDEKHDTVDVVIEEKHDIVDVVIEEKHDTVDVVIEEKNDTVDVVIEAKNDTIDVVIEEKNYTIDIVDDSIDDNNTDDILQEIKNIILINENSKTKNENIVLNVTKIDHNKANKSNKDININNILNDLTTSCKDDNYIKDIETSKNKNNYMNIVFYNKKYLINTHKVISSNLNMYNLNNMKILKENIINNNKISLILENKNSSYLINYFNQIYLFNKVSEKLLITNLKNKKTLVLQTNSFFKLLNNNFYLTSDCMTIIPIINRKVYNNINGQSINYFEPIISS